MRMGQAWPWTNEIGQRCGVEGAHWWIGCSGGSSVLSGIKGKDGGKENGTRHQEACLIAGDEAVGLCGSDATLLL
jgi:hypothetical protein